MSDLIYKIVSQTEWQTAQSIGLFLGSVVDLKDGFVHFSTAAQVPETACKHFAGQKELLLVEVEVSVFGDELKWEPSRGGDLFPHLYCPLQVDSVNRVLKLPLDTDGKHIFPPEFW